MDNETQEQPEEFTVDDFEAMSKGIASGIDMILKAQNADAEYVLCIHHKGLEEMGVVTNAPPHKAMHMVKSVSEEMEQEQLKKAFKKTGIILPH